LRKLSNTWNTRLVWLVGGLILFVLFRFIKKKKSDPTTTGISDFFSKVKNLKNPSFAEIRSLIIREEVGSEANIKFNAYPDAQGYSIGIGHFIKPNESDLLTRTITMEEVNTLFAKDLESITDTINSSVQVPLTSNQKLALYSFIYNVGSAAFRGSTLLKLLNKGDYQGAADQFQYWNKSTGKDGIKRVLPGLVNRRKREKDLFLSNVNRMSFNI
jgi:GH24 family phage-related lysozyme (muramidase)